jgi:hypothetical protein
MSSLMKLHEEEYLQSAVSMERERRKHNPMRE